METNQNETQCTALLNEIARTMIPAEPKVVMLADQLAPYRKAIRQLREDGYTAAQIVTMLAHPKIGIKASVSSLRKFLNSRGGRPKGARNEAPLRLFENSAPPAPRASAAPAPNTAPVASATKR